MWLTKTNGMVEKHSRSSIPTLIAKQFLIVSVGFAFILRFSAYKKHHRPGRNESGRAWVSISSV